MRPSIRSARLVALVAVCLCAHAPQLFADECPELIGVLSEPWDPTLVAVSGDYAYFLVGIHPGLLNVADVSNPSAPQVVGQIEISNYSIRQIAVQGGYAYTAGQNSFSGASLRVIDVSDPTAPVEVGRFDDPDLTEATAVAVSGAHAYVGVGFSLRVLDVSDPTTPVEVGSLETSIVLDVAVSGRYAYVSGWAVMPCYLHVIDVSVPSEPVELSSMNTYCAGAIAVEGNYLYTVFSGGGLGVIDVTDPSAPVEVGSVALPYEFPQDVAVSSGYAYVADGSAGLRVIDVREPTAPVEVGFFDTEGGAVSVSVSDGYVYLAVPYGGLMIFRECSVFLDGFESGDASAWSAMVP